MTVEVEKGKPQSAEELGRELVEFVAKTEFGNPEYQAVSDLIDRKGLEQSLKQEYQNALSKEEEGENSQYGGSRARITEYKIALLEHQMSQCSSRVQGYQSAYVHLDIALSELYSTAHKEAQGKFPDDPEQQYFYAEDLYATVFDRAQNTLNIKRQ